MPANSNLTISTNMFGTPTAGGGLGSRADGIDLDTPTPWLLISNNTFQPGSGPYFADGALAGTNTQVTGNKMLLFPCQNGVAYKNNTIKPAFAYVTLCDPSDTLATSDWPFELRR
jgi:hypothetical protein